MPRSRDLPPERRWCLLSAAGGEKSSQQQPSKSTMLIEFEDVCGSISYKVKIDGAGRTVRGAVP